jgi:MATE family multidrug resistance protein
MPSETTPFLPHLGDASLHDISDNEVVNYIQTRRASIASIASTVIPEAYHVTHGGMHERLIPSKSHTSSQHGAVTDISEILSTHSMVQEPETDVIKESKALLKYSVPIIITFLLKYSLTVASVFSVGRLGSKELAAVSLSSMTANITGFAIIQGVSTCLDTLCAQAFGRKDYNSVGIHFIRCNILLLLCCIPMCILWIFGARPILTSLVGADQSDLCDLAARYLEILSVGLPANVLFENATHFLQCQGIFHASTYVLFVCAPVNAVLNYFLVWDPTIGMGFIGAPLSVVITNWLMCISIYSYIFFVRGSECLPKESIWHPIYLQNWQRMIDLSVPGVLMVVAEWLAFEIITFTSARFGTEVLAAQSILTTTCGLLYQIPMSLSINTSTRIAWYIGAASKKSATIAAKAANITCAIMGVVNGTFIFTFRRPLASLYTNDQQVIDLASKVLIIAAIYQINEFLSCSTAGILRGQGRQKIGGYTNLISYYLIALPSAFTFAFYFKMELIGLWLGMIIALFIGSVVQLYFVATSDWDHIINKCIVDAIADETNC